MPLLVCARTNILKISKDFFSILLKENFLFFCFVYIRGKFGTVYKCKEKSTGTCLAAKFIAVPNRQERKNVEREIQMMNNLQHPKIIQLYDAYEYNKMVCVVLEL